MLHLLKEFDKLSINDKKLLFKYYETTNVKEICQHISKIQRAYLDSPDIPYEIKLSTVETFVEQDFKIQVNGLFQNGTNESWNILIQNISQERYTIHQLIYIITLFCQNENASSLSDNFSSVLSILLVQSSTVVKRYIYLLLIFNKTNFEITNDFNQTLIEMSIDNYLDNTEKIYILNLTFAQPEYLAFLKNLSPIKRIPERILVTFMHKLLHTDVIINSLTTSVVDELLTIYTTLKFKTTLLKFFGKNNFNKYLQVIEENGTYLEAINYLVEIYNVLKDQIERDGNIRNIFNYIPGIQITNRTITHIENVLNNVEIDENTETNGPPRPQLTAQQRMEQMRQARARALANIPDDDDEDKEPEAGDCDNPTDISLNNWTATNQPTTKLVVFNDQLFPRRTLCFKFQELAQIIESNTTMVPWLLKNKDRPIDSIGYGGGPPARNVAYPELEFKAIPPENYYIANWQIINPETVYYYLLPIEKIRIGNISGQFGVSMIHGQDEYQIYLVVRKDHVEQDVREYLEKLLVHRTSVILQSDIALNKIKEIYREHLPRDNEYDSRGLLKEYYILTLEQV